MLIILPAHNIEPSGPSPAKRISELFTLMSPVPDYAFKTRLPPVSTTYVFVPLLDMSIELGLALFAIIDIVSAP